MNGRLDVTLWGRGGGESRKALSWRSTRNGAARTVKSQKGKRNIRIKVVTTPPLLLYILLFIHTILFSTQRGGKLKLTEVALSRPSSTPTERAAFLLLLLYSSATGIEHQTALFEWAFHAKLINARREGVSPLLYLIAPHIQPSNLFEQAFRYDEKAPRIQWSNQSTLFERAFRQNTNSRRMSAEHNSSDAKIRHNSSNRHDKK